MTFGENRVLHDVAIDVRPGEIHGLIGQNGSGKSTLAKVLSGLYKPDPAARIAVDGVELQLPVRPHEARERGVAVVHQSLGLIDSRSVLENMRVGRLSGSRVLRRIDWNHERRAAEQVFARIGRPVPLDALVGSLREEERATVAVARALQDVHPGTGLIIFDESTRSLSRRSLEHFFQILDEIVATGSSVLLITHRLEEIVQAADRVTVLRDGRVVEQGRELTGVTEVDLTAMMLGRDLLELEQRTPHSTARSDEDGVTIDLVSGQDVRDVSLTVMPGEIVGVTGLAGSGYDELLYLICGAKQASNGSVTLRNETIELSGLSPADAIRAGIALVPEGREHSGLAMSLSAVENISLPATACSNDGVRPISRSAEGALVSGWIDRLEVRPPAPHALVRTFSGGNQQKLLLAKWLSAAPTLLLLHEPTQAVDVGARQTLVAAVHSAAEQGCAVLVAGSDENELALLCDRILVFVDGRVDQQLTGPMSPDRIVESIYSSGTRVQLRKRQ